MKRLVLIASVLAVAGCTANANAPDHSKTAPAARALYRWRGVHLDVARHYFDIPALKKIVDLEAHLGLNVLHLHFTDDSAWRLPSHRYPKLTTEQHYTEAQLRDFVSYAKQRGITIVPEIDVPAHAGAAIRAYPKLGCGDAYELCPSAATSFADAQLNEIVRIFPSAWIHTGGDEVTGWNDVQRRAFETHIAGTLERLHRTAVVWDDEADVVPPSTIVMVWHLGDAARNAIRSGHQVVMASDGPLYFNAAQGDPKQEPAASRYVSTLEEVYAFSPPREGVLGVEATLWTEKISATGQLWYMLLPRAVALAEVASIPPAQKSWPRFYRSLPQQLRWLDEHGYRYRVPNVMFTVNDPRARFAGVAGNMNAASAYIASPTVTVAAESSLLSGQTFMRSNGGRWRATLQLRDVTVGSAIEAYCEIRGRRSAVTTLFIRAGESETAARSKSFDAVVSP